MFDVNENGDLIYSNPSGATPVPGIPGGSLYDAPEETPAPQDDGIDSPSGDASADIQIPDGSLSSPDPGRIDSDVSGGDAFPVSGDLSLTTSGDIYIYPDIPADASLLDDRSAASATVLGLPNTASLQYLEDAARGYPSWYKYMAFKTDASYSQSMVLYIGAAGEKNPSQNRIDFTNVDRIEINYIRSGTTNYYQYQKYHYDSCQVPYNTDVFLYTNVVDGYAEFDLPSGLPVAGILFTALAVGIVSLILKGGGKR